MFDIFSQLAAATISDEVCTALSYYSPTLAAFAAGRASALVVDCGGGSTSVVPVVDGYVLRTPIMRSSRGGEWLDDQVREVVEKQQSLQTSSSTPFKIHPRYAISKKRKKTSEGAEKESAKHSMEPSLNNVGLIKEKVDGSNISNSETGTPNDSEGKVFDEDRVWTTSVTKYTDTHPSYERRCVLEVTRGLKEAMCGLPLIRFENAGLAHHLPVPGMPGSYELPDGTVVQLTPELYRIPERLFDDPIESGSSTGNQSSRHQSHVALQKMVHQCVSNCDGDIRKEMIGNILLTGAGSQFKYFPERLQREVAATVPSLFKVKIICPEKIERRFGVWIGGSIMSSLGSFQQMWLSKAEYDEMGASKAAARFSQ